MARLVVMMEKPWEVSEWRTGRFLVRKDSEGTWYVVFDDPPCDAIELRNSNDGEIRHFETADVAMHAAELWAVAAAPPNMRRD